MKIDKNILEVHGRNELNRVGNLFANEYVKQLESFLNQKIVTIQGFTKKFKDTILKNHQHKVKPLENGFAQVTRNFLDAKYGSLYLCFTICLNGGQYENKTNYCKYFEKDIYLGELDEQTKTILTKIAKIEPFEPIDLQTELNKIAEYKELIEKANKIKNSIKIEYDSFK
jgi:hypothetical protein